MDQQLHVYIYIYISCGLTSTIVRLHRKFLPLSSYFLAFLITLRVPPTNNENILHKQSQPILCIEHNFHSLSRIQFFSSSCCAAIGIKLNVNERKKSRIIASFLHIGFRYIRSNIYKSPLLSTWPTFSHAIIIIIIIHNFPTVNRHLPPSLHRVTEETFVRSKGQSKG